MKTDQIDIPAAFATQMSSHLNDIYQGYYAGEASKFLPAPTDVQSLGSGADFHYRNEARFYRMMERARQYDRDNMVVGQGINRLVGNVMQEGFTVDPSTGDREADAELSKRWNDWADDPEACDYEGEKPFGQMAELALRNTVVDGDVCVIPTSEGSLQFVEAHRLRSPRRSRREAIVHGVELHGSRKRVAYHFTEEDINPNSTIGINTHFRRIPVRDSEGRRQLHHLYDPKRFSQHRGVTAMAPSVVPIQYHDDIQFANMVKAKVASFFALFRQYDAESDHPSNRRFGERSTETLGDGSSRTFETGQPGAIVRGDPGEKLIGFSPNIPNPEFFDHAYLILTIVSINLDLPLAVLLLDPSKTNFSGWRGAIDQARIGFRRRQRWLSRSLHSPTYQWKLRQWIVSDPVIRRFAGRLGPAIFNHRFHAPTWGYIEPAKDAASDDVRVTRNLISQRRRAAERGLDFDTLSSEIVQDRATIVEKAIEAATRLNETYPDAGVDWRELAYGHQSSGINYTFGSNLQDETSDRDNDE